MPNVGSGTLTQTPNVTTPGIGHIYPPILPCGSCGISLDRYQELMRLPIAAFNGLNRPEEEPVYECSTIWKQSERNALQLALCQAEEMRENELTYHITPKYDVLEDLEPKNPLILPRKHLIKLGLQTITDISLDVALILGANPNFNDPVVITVATTVTDTSEIVVYFHGEDYTITPSSISISGGVATIKIPRSRLVKPELLDDRDDHLYYNDNNNFIDTIDIKRVYYDETNPAQYVCNSLCNTPTTDSACARVTDHRLAIVRHHAATYSNGVWEHSCESSCHCSRSLTVYALSGKQCSVYNEMLTIRLAHTLMPNAPCSCPTVHQYWQNDIKETDVLTPYGRTQGAVDTWSMDARAKVGQGGKFPNTRRY